MTDGGSKRKLVGREEEVYFWFNSLHAHKCAALFKLEFTMDGDVIIPKDNSLEMVAAFFEQHERRGTAYVACVLVGSSSTSCKYLLMPNEFDHTIYHKYRHEQPLPRELPCTYTIDPVNGSYPCTFEKPPIGRKLDPIAVTVSNKVYVLSRRNLFQVVLPEPSFEAYDIKMNSWETLPTPWFNLDTLPFLPNRDSNQNLKSPGYAVFGQFIIVCSRNIYGPTRFYIHSYNTISQEWKPVRYPTITPLSVVVYRDDGSYVDTDTNDNDYDEDGFARRRFHGADYLVWVGEALVVKNFIHAYVEMFGTLVTYKCCYSASDDTLSLEGRITMEHCGFRQHWTPWLCALGGVSGAVGKIRDDLICMVKTIWCITEKIGSISQPVHIMIFRLHEEGGIRSMLRSIDLSMPACDDFKFGLISSCFLLPPEVASNRVNGERNPKKRELSYKGCDASLVSDVEMMATTSIA